MHIPIQTVLLFDALETLFITQNLAATGFGKVQLAISLLHSQSLVLTVFGLKDLALAEHNCPSHMACRELFELALLFNKLNINGPSHMACRVLFELTLLFNKLNINGPSHTATQTVLLSETLQALNALVL